jgi:outer membrane protein OmpA-like peptidoglycan-associated protein
MATTTDPLSQLPLILTDVIGRDARDEKEQLPRLVKEFTALQAESARRIEQTLSQFAADPDLQVDDRAGGSPSQVVLKLTQPDGEPVTRVRVQVVGAESDAALTTRGLQALQPLRDGSVLLKLPSEWRRRALKNLVVSITGGQGSQTVKVPIATTTVDGEVLPLTLPKRADPLPLAVFEGLGELAALANDDPAVSPPAAPVKPRVSIGEADCNLVFRTDPSEDRFAYSLLFRLTDPGMSLPTVARSLPPPDAAGAKALRAVFPDNVGSPLRLTDLHLVDRVAIDRPVSVEAFQTLLSGVQTPRTLPLAATLAVGYVVTLAQRWTQKGLALGDLVYSLPLAPGEQQRIVVVERTQSTSVMEREVLEQREDLRFDETDTSSVQATVSSAFREAAQGGSEYQADSSSFSIAAAAGGGGVWPFGAFAGGVATSYGSASASGSTSTWMSGARQATSNAAQTTQAAVSRRASASRNSSRASVRLATASESTEVTTKVIANHNRTRALTMQYWEVLRLFDVSTVVEDVSLVCMVPLDVVDFLPAREPAQLAAGTVLNRDSVLARYAKLLRHSDVLSRRVPWRLRRGLQALNDFAADPRASVQAATGPALQTITVSVEGGFTLLDRPTVQLLLRNGIRTAPMPLGNLAATVPDGLGPLPSGVNAFPGETELFAELRRRRSGRVTMTATIALPGSVSLPDVVGLLVGNAVNRLDYTFAPPGVGLAQGLLSGNPAQLATVLAGIAAQTPVSRTFGADRVARETGDLTLTLASATVGTSVTLASQSWPTRIAVPGAGLTVSANRMAPELSYDSLLEIERTLQWVLRNTMSCSLGVVAAMTAEERTIMLERYSVTTPTVARDGTIVEGVPLLSCVTNKVLGFYGNSIVMPFQIPFELAQRLKVDTGRIQSALKRFHTEAFDHPTSTTALPTRGVLGEAVLGNCASAEKIDLTRFWNWKDSPIEQAPDINAVTVPADNRLQGLEAPSKLTSLTPIINNFSTQGPGTADSALATALVGKLGDVNKSFDVGALTNAGNLKELVVKTTDTAEAARKDALGAAKEITLKAMEVSAALKGVKPPGADGKDAAKDKGTGTGTGGSGSGTGGTGGTGGGTTPTPTVPTPTTPPAAPAVRPQMLQAFFNLDKIDLVETTAEGRTGQTQRIADFVAQAKAFKATAVLVRGYASPEGTEQRNFELVAKRAEALATKLRAELPGVTVSTATGGIVSGPPSSQFPELRRADAVVTAP